MGFLGTEILKQVRSAPPKTRWKRAILVENWVSRSLIPGTHLLRSHFWVKDYYHLISCSSFPFTKTFKQTPKSRSVNLSPFGALIRENACANVNPP